MTPKEKAKQLLDIMSSQTYQYQPYAGAHCNVEEIGCEAGKKCALIAVSELIRYLPFSSRILTDFTELDKQFWQQVKTEINNI